MRAQATIFVFIGLFLLFILLLVIMLLPKNSLQEQNQQISDFTLSSSSAEQLFTNCLQTHAQEAVTLLGLRGGQIYLDETYLKRDDLQIAYTYYDGKIELSKNRMQQELAYYTREQVAQCIQDSVYFWSQMPTIVVTIEQDDVLFFLNNSLTISEGTNRRIVETSQFILPIRLGRVLDAAQHIANDIIVAPQFRDLDFLQNDIAFDYEIINNDYLFIFKDNSTNPYLFFLAAHLSPKDTNKPKLFTIPHLNATIGERFTYQLEASGDTQLFYFFSTPYFDADTLDGTFSFTPLPSYLGDHTFIAKVLDEEGKEDSQIVKLTIKGDIDFTIAVRNHTITTAQNFTYQPFVSNPAGLNITYTLTTFPSNATINQTTGRIFWSPQIGMHNFTIQAASTNTKNATFTVEVNQ